MSSLVVTAAKAALTESSPLIGKDEPVGKLEGRSVVHWSYKLYIAGAVVGAIALVAGAVLGALFMPALYSLLAMGVILCATNSYAAVQIKRYSILQSLEETTKALAERVKLLATKIKEFQQEINAFEELNKKFKDIPEDWNEEIQAGKQEITKKAQELEEAARALSEAQKKLDKFAALTAEIQKATGNLSSVVSGFSTKEHDFDGSVAQMKEELNQLNSSSSKLVEQTHVLDVKTDDFEKAGQLFTAQVDTIGKLFAQFNGLFANSDDKIAQLTAESAKLKKDLEQAQAAVTSLEEVEKKYEAMLPRMETEINRLKGLEHDAAKWRAYKAAEKAEKTKKALEELKGTISLKAPETTSTQTSTNTPVTTSTQTSTNTPVITSTLPPLSTPVTTSTQTSSDTATTTPVSLPKAHTLPLPKAIKQKKEAKKEAKTEDGSKIQDDHKAHEDHHEGLLHNLLPRRHSHHKSPGSASAEESKSHGDEHINAGGDTGTQQAQTKEKH